MDFVHPQYDLASVDSTRLWRGGDPSAVCSGAGGAKAEGAGAHGEA